MTANPIPAVFFGHGNPMNVLLDNEFTRGWAAERSRIPRPKAILSVSAHWYLPAGLVTAMPSPRTIHDFGGFPRELYEVQYPAPGDPALAKRVRTLLAPVPIELDDQWGLDHGTWSVLHHLFPQADVPVVQLSIDSMQPAHFHYDIGKRLAPLREEGILIVGSGNLVHNLHAYAWGGHSVEAYDWAGRFEKQARKLILDGNDSRMIEFEKLGPDARLAAPTPDHYLPLLYILGLRRAGEPVSFPVEGFDGGSISMLAVQIGNPVFSAGFV